MLELFTFTSTDVEGQGWKVANVSAAAEVQTKTVRQSKVTMCIVIAKLFCAKHVSHDYRLRYGGSEREAWKGT